MRALLKSAMIQDELAKTVVRDVRRVWAHEPGGGRLLIAVSIKQRFLRTLTVGRLHHRAMPGRRLHEPLRHCRR
jgi:hypothetical protein